MSQQNRSNPALRAGVHGIAVAIFVWWSVPIGFFGTQLLFPHTPPQYGAAVLTAVWWFIIIRAIIRGYRDGAGE